MGVKIIKESYYTSQRDNNSFNYAGDNQNFVPNPDNPIIFHLRRKGKAEPLVTCDFPGFAKITQLRRDGTPTEISLSDCAVSVPGAGQLKLEFWGDKIERTTKKFNWKLRITVPGGGMIETDEEFNFSAPENGYLPMVEIDMPTSLETWQTQIERKYFIRLNDGKYGRLDFSLLARNGVFRIGSAINPSGSRNLEFDPAAQPKQTQFE